MFRVSGVKEKLLEGRSEMHQCFLDGERKENQKWMATDV